MHKSMSLKYEASWQVCGGSTSSRPARRRAMAPVATRNPSTAPSTCRTSVLGPARRRSAPRTMPPAPNRNQTMAPTANSTSLPTCHALRREGRGGMEGCMECGMVGLLCLPARLSVRGPPQDPIHSLCLSLPPRGTPHPYLRKVCSSLTSHGANSGRLTRGAWRILSDSGLGMWVFSHLG